MIAPALCRCLHCEQANRARWQAEPAPYMLRAVDRTTIRYVVKADPGELEHNERNEKRYPHPGNLDTFDRAWSRK